MGGGTVGFEGLGYGTDCIRELLLRRKYRASEPAQPVHHDRSHDVPVLWTALSRLQSRTGSYNDACNACDTSFSSRPSSFCCLRQRSQRTDVADLSLSTGEHCGTMYSRNDINFCSQRTDLGDLHGRPDACGLLRSSCGRSSSGTGKQPHLRTASHSSLSAKASSRRSR